MKCGVTVIVATTGAAVLFVAVNASIFPVLPAPRPILVLSFVKTYEVALPVNVTAVVDALLQTTWSAGSSTVGVGLTVIVNEVGEPSHPSTVALTVTLDTIGAFVPLAAVKMGILVMPLDANPMAELEFVH